jgi:hypothetical protein
MAPNLGIFCLLLCGLPQIAAAGSAARLAVVTGHAALLYIFFATFKRPLDTPKSKPENLTDRVATDCFFLLKNDVYWHVAR